VLRAVPAWKVRPAPVRKQWTPSFVMPNLSSILKAEITRLARKELKSSTANLQKAVAAHRSDIAALKRRASQLEKELRQTRRAQRPGSSDAPAKSDADATKVRYSAKSLIAQRKRLGLSAAELGLLFGTTGQSVYNWESGSARPSAKHLATLAALRKLGKKQAAEIVADRRARPG
jgi:DNA-binding transcriptional regulator YiaG